MTSFKRGPGAGAVSFNSRLMRMEYTSEMSQSKPMKEKSLMHASNKKIFIGAAFQAIVPDSKDLRTYEQDMTENHSRENYSHEIRLWAPSDRISDAKLDALVAELKPKGFDEDQILAFLYYQDFNIDATLQGLTGKYVGKQEGMPLHDKVLFVQGYGFHGKNFDKIRDLVPNHSMQSLVNHYYTQFKREKQNKGAAARPETDVRKQLANAAVLSTIPDVNLRLNPLNPLNPLNSLNTLQYLEADNSRNVQDILANGMRFLENADEESARNLLKIGGASRHSQLTESFNGIAGLDAATITNDDPTGQLEEQEKGWIERCNFSRIMESESLRMAKIDVPPQASAEQDAATAAAREENQKDPTPVWQQEEILIFMRSLVEFGNDFTKSSLLLPNKTEQQVRNMYYNRSYFYGLDKIVKFHDDAETMKLNAVNSI